MMQLGKIPQNGTLLAVSHFPNIHDLHLRLVLVELHGRFVTWMVNVETGDYGSGHYFDFNHVEDNMEEMREAAFRDFIMRLTDKVSDSVWTREGSRVTLNSEP